MLPAARGLEGRQIGRYRLRFKIAEGGMAAVYLAQLAGPHGFERWVAVKVIHPHHAADETFTKMLLDEARTAARIHHPNVCSVVDFGEENGLVHLVMEYLEGEPLSSVVRRAWRSPEGLPLWLAARIAVDAARGLHAAHELTDATGESLQVVHRDVSPQNLVVLYDGHTKVIDFGIARARSNIASTRVGQVKGKIAYLSPEQLAGVAVDRQVDVWALGVVLFEATIGRRLFRADNAAETARNVVTGAIPRPSDERSGYPPSLERIVLRALERNRSKRYQTAADLADDLEAFLYEGDKPAGASRVANYMKRAFDDRLTIRKALLSADDAPGGGVLEVHDLHSDSSIGGVIGGEHERSGERARLGRRQDSEIENPAIDEFLSDLPGEADILDLPFEMEAGEPEEVVDLAALLEPDGQPGHVEATSPVQGTVSAGGSMAEADDAPVQPRRDSSRSMRLVLPTGRAVVPPPTTPQRRRSPLVVALLVGLLVLAAAAAAAVFLGL